MTGRNGFLFLPLKKIIILEEWMEGHLFCHWLMYIVDMLR